MGRTKKVEGDAPKPKVKKTPQGKNDEQVKIELLERTKIKNFPFPKGKAISVKKETADKLIEEGKAKLI